MKYLSDQMHTFRIIFQGTKNILSYINVIAVRLNKNCLSLRSIKNYENGSPNPKPWGVPKVCVILFSSTILIRSNHENRRRFTCNFNCGDII